MTSNNTISFFKVFLFAFLLFSLSQRSIADNNTVVAQVADQDITFGQVAKAYNKNLPEGSKKLSELKLDSVIGFIDLYTNYRLKVIDALDKGYHQKPEIVQEIRQNQERLAESHLLNSMLIEPHVEKIKKRRLSEFKMAYILLREDSTSSMSPTETAEMIIGKLDAGEPFSKLAKKYSMDPSTSESGGILDVYVTSGRIQPDLEDALYSLEVGQYHPEPISNQFGTFVVKLHDMQPRIAVKSAHILIAAKQVGSGDWEIKEKLADSIYQAIKNGASFEEMVEKHSSDETSVSNGGVLEGWYVRSGGFIGRSGKLVEEYEEKLFELKDGEISEPVKTKYGYHIIKRAISEQANADDEEDGIKDIYRKTLMETERRAIMDSIRNSYGLEVNQAVLDEFLSQLDSQKNNYDNNWADGVKDGTKTKELFKFNGSAYTVSEYIEQSNNNPKLKGIANIELSIRSGINKIIEPKVYELLGEKFRAEDEEYMALSEEFRDGILLYQVETDEVWDKLKFDSVAAKEYFIKNKLEYKTNPTVDFTEIYLVDETVTSEIMDRIEKGEDITDLAGKYTERAKYRDSKGKWEAQDIKKNRILLKVMGDELKEGNTVGPLEVDMGQSIIRIDKIYPPRVKTFEESIPDFASQFQDYRNKQLTSNWISYLREKYDVKVYEDKLKSLLKNQ